MRTGLGRHIGSVGKKAVDLCVWPKAEFSFSGSHVHFRGTEDAPATVRRHPPLTHPRMETDNQSSAELPIMLAFRSRHNRQFMTPLSPAA